jgi:hypothetical protein
VDGDGSLRLGHYLAILFTLLLFCLIAIRDRELLGQPFFLDRLPLIP